MMYDILAASSIAGLIKLVDNAVLEGWHPQGGVCVIFLGREGYHFYQAMVLPSSRGERGNDENA